MDIESQLRRLEAQYRAASNAETAARAHYAALLAEPGVALSTLGHAKGQCRRLDERKQVLAARLEEIEELESPAHF